MVEAEAPIKAVMAVGIRAVVLAVSKQWVPGVAELQWAEAGVAVGDTLAATVTTPRVWGAAGNTIAAPERAVLGVTEATAGAGEREAIGDKIVAMAMREQAVPGVATTRVGDTIALTATRERTVPGDILAKAAQPEPAAAGAIWAAAAQPELAAAGDIPNMREKLSDLPITKRRGGERIPLPIFRKYRQDQATAGHPPIKPAQILRPA